MPSSSKRAPDGDVIVLGGGMAGLAAAMLLSRSGRNVTCVDYEGFPRARVGESLDWSAPSMLRGLGFRIEELVASGVGTYKRDIQVVSPDRAPLTASPPRLLSKRPFGAEMTTVHIDRERFDAALFDRARRSGVEFVRDMVSAVRMEGDRVAECTTRGGRHLGGAWFIDASGTSRLIGRAADIGLHAYAAQRVCLWSDVNRPRAREGTTLSLDTRKTELEWAWQIPLADDRQSVGLVMPAAAFGAVERAGSSRAQVMAGELARFPGFAHLAPEDFGEVRARAYRPYVSTRVVGANWLMAGESAAMIDPLTSIGVTAALRNGSEAASIIIGAGRPSSQATRAAIDYDRRVRSLGHLYNTAIERLIYQPQLRRAFGLRAAGFAYVLLGYGTNTLYTRLRPMSPRRTRALGILVGAYGLWTRTWVAAATPARRDDTA